MNEIKLSPRLNAAAEFVREGKTVADVGTDHAYLPIYLVSCGKTPRAVASDINEGPYRRAADNVRAYGLCDRIYVLHCSGLDGIERYSPQDIIICGMGGELIASILEGAPWTKNGNIRLILQPMTHPEALRGFLLGNGYRIVDERLVKEDRIYQIICASYGDGTSSDCEDSLCNERVFSGDTDSPYNGAELLVGRINARRRTPLFFELAQNQIKTQMKIKNSKKGDVSAQERLIFEIQELTDDRS